MGESVSSKLAGVVHQLMDGTDISCEIVLPSDGTLRFGSAPPDFRVVFHSTRALTRGFDEFSLGQAYVNGEIDIEGDMMSLLDMRAHLNDRKGLFTLLGFGLSLFLRSPISGNRKSIQAHYSFGDDFYLTFIDSKYRFYSHGIFHSDDETLEQASEHKLETMYDALELEQGKRLLDIGCGWGGVAQYCGSRGVHVTSVTLAQDSYDYVKNLIRAEGLEHCDVYHEDFLQHQPQAPYDAIVIYGVIEHIPCYRRFFQRVWECLRTGGLFYLDASATKQKFDISTFTRHYIWRGTHSFMCLQDVIQELLFHGLELIEVKRETRDYELTLHEWAKRFDAGRDTIVERWGEQVYRAFRVYLWSGCYALCNDHLQAYHLVARREARPGPRPGLVRRTRNFVSGLA